MTIENALDQQVALTPAELKSFEVTDEVIRKAIDEENFDYAMQYVRSLRRSSTMQGLNLAKVLFELKDNWHVFGIAEDFNDVVFNDTGLSQQTIKKYIALWKEVFTNPDIEERVKSALMGKPVKGLLLLTAAARDNDLTQADWDEVADAPDTATITEIVRRARGQHTNSKNRIVIRLLRNGDLEARKGEDLPASIGYLNKSSTDPVVQAAIERLISSAGIVEE